MDTYSDEDSVGAEVTLLLARRDDLVFLDAGAEPRVFLVLGGIWNV